MFDPSKHPRAANGRFGSGGSAETVGAKHLRASNVDGAQRIIVHSPRMRKYRGFATVEAFAAAHPKGRAHALRLLAADHKAGKISFAPAPAALNIDVDSTTSAAFKAEIERGWNLVLPGVKARLAAAKITAHAPGRLIDEMPALVDKQPRGWPTGSTWKEVNGAFDPGSRKLIVAETSYRPRTDTWRPENRAVGTLLHETGHALDRALNYRSLGPEFTDAYNADVAALRKDADPTLEKRFEYFLQPGTAGRSEMFAEMHAVVLNEPSNPWDPPMWKRFPRCARQMIDLLKTA